MGIRDYTPAVDMWSVGCIFAEMALGKPLFTGMCEVDQLFQIFSKLGTPTAETWPGFSTLPNNSDQFPHWSHNRLAAELPSCSNLDDVGIDLLQKLLAYEPERRLSAEAALAHPYFAAQSSASEGEAGNVSEPAETAHARLFLSHLQEKEGSQHSGRCFLDVHTSDIRNEHRAQLVDWLVEVVDAFDMCERTAFLATNLTDRFLCEVKGERRNLQLIGKTRETALRHIPFIVCEKSDGPSHGIERALSHSPSSHSIHVYNNTLF